VFSGYCSNDSSEFRTYADAGVPMVHFNTLQDNVDYVTDNNITNIYQGCPSEIWYGRGFVPLMQTWIEAGIWKPSSKTAAVVTSNDSYSISIANALSEDIKKIGWTVPIFEQVTAPTADWGPVLSKIRANPPGLIFVTDYIAGDLASFAKQFATAPTQSLLYQQYGPSIPEYIQLAGDAANGVIWSTTIGTLPDQMGDDFLKLYQQKFNAQAGLSQAGCQYDIVQMWAGAAALAGDPYNFAQVNKLLKQTIYRGVNGIYRLTSPELPNQLVVPPYPDLIDDPSLAMPHLTYQIQNLKQVAISPVPYAAGKLELPPWLK
jgi:branched-chain amino acid transport system substrate-binding protein